MLLVVLPSCLSFDEVPVTNGGNVCAQVNVVNGGSGSPGPLVSFPGAYTGHEPGLLINIYSPQSSYTPPGPSVWPANGVSGGGGGGGSSSIATSKSVTTASSATATVTSSPATSTSSPGAAQYAQCGGQGFTGPTTCVSPYTCKASSQYYSQCL